MAHLTCLVGLVFSLSSLSFVLSISGGASPVLNNRQLGPNGIPSVGDFLNRAYHSAIVLNEYLYIDGGEISFSIDGNSIHLPDNETYSIDLSSSWTNQTVTFNRIEKAAPVLNYVALWADSTNSSYYAWAGEVSAALPSDQRPPAPPKSVWKFTATGAGSGSWSEEPMSPTSLFSSLTRPAGGIAAYGNGTGLLLGGYSSAGSSPETARLSGFVPIPGIVSHDIEAGTWRNDSATGYSAYGTAMYGEMQYVSGFPNEGLLVAMGGSTSDALTWTDTGANYVPFQQVKIFDPATSTWHTQTASGTIPRARSRFCSVGARGDNGTYEIFIYGGHVASSSQEAQVSSTDAERQRNIDLDEVFVLSLPGFVWTKANYTATRPRVNHACNAAVNRQMIVTGGLNPASTNITELVLSADVWAQGVGVFDMTSMQWKDSYDANAEPYITPEAVKSWYAANGPYPAEWDDPVMEGFFNPSAAAIDPSDPSDPEAGPSSNPPVF